MIEAHALMQSIVQKWNQRKEYSMVIFYVSSIVEYSKFSHILCEINLSWKRLPIKVLPGTDTYSIWRCLVIYGHPLFLLFLIFPSPWFLFFFQPRHNVFEITLSCKYSSGGNTSKNEEGKSLIFLHQPPLNNATYSLSLSHFVRIFRSFPFSRENGYCRWMATAAFLNYFWKNSYLYSLQENVRSQYFPCIRLPGMSSNHLLVESFINTYMSNWG